MKVCFAMAAGLWLILMAGTLGGSAAQSNKPPAPTILFTVAPPQKGAKPSGAWIDPIVVIQGSVYNVPPESSDGQDKKADALNDQFEKTQFDAGHKYALLSGGAQIGTATVIEPVGVTCISTTATVRLSTPVNHEALAASSTEMLGLHPNWRRAATAEERSMFVGLAADYLKTNGVRDFQASAIKVDHLRATKLGAAEPDTLIGDLTLEQKTGIHVAFLMATKKDGKYSTVLSSYHTFRDGDDSSQTTEHFLDQLDLDHDGEDEIITIFSYYELWEYAIYKQRDGKWVQVYKGAGGGC